MTREILKLHCLQVILLFIYILVIYDVLYYINWQINIFLICGSRIGLLRCITIGQTPSNVKTKSWKKDCEPALLGESHRSWDTQLSSIHFAILNRMNERLQGFRRRYRYSVETRETKRLGDWALVNPPTISPQDINRHRRGCKSKALGAQSEIVNLVTPLEIKFDVWD